METIKIKTTHFVETEFNLPKYFKIAHHYQMILDDKNYLFVKSRLENTLLIYPEISIHPISYSAGRWYDETINQELIPISEQEFKDEFTKASVGLLNGHSITQLEALTNFGCFRLAARISNLRDKGLNVVTDMVTLENGKRVARYILKK
jgi:hypothetical protein